jgi:hypothetical protein
MGKPKRYSSKELTNHLREMAAEAHDMMDDGSVLTRGEALALLLWRKALGYTEKRVDDEGTETEVYHEPASWAIQLVYERMEGRTPQAITEDEQRIKAADRVRDLAKSRLNSLAQKATAVAPDDSTKKPPKPPKHKKKPDAE